MIDRSRLSDEELMERCRDGDVHCFNELINRYKRPLYNFIYRFVGDKELSEDIFQDTFLRIFKVAKSYKPTAKFSTFAYKIASNLSINELKKRKVRKYVPIDDEVKEDEEEHHHSQILKDEQPLALESLLEKERDEKVKQALAILPEHQRVVLILNFYEGLKYEEIAQVLGCSIGTVKSRIHRAKSALYKFLKDYELF